MTTVRLFMFDDQQARQWAPFTLTRPLGELLFGCLTLRDRAERVFGATCEGHLSHPALMGFDEPGGAPGFSHDDVGNTGVRVLLSSRAVLDFQAIDLPATWARIFVGGEAAGWVIPDGTPIPTSASLSSPEAESDDGPRLDLSGHTLDSPWHLISINGDRIEADIAHLWSDDSAPVGVHRIGSGLLSMAAGSTIESGVHVDLRDGPVRLDAGVRVEGPARLTGPLFIGRDCTVLGGSVGTSSFGPVCLVRGEIAHSVFLGFVNKAHDGHIGHAMLGRWVNLGAFTTNSDLKNNYSSVRVWTPEGERDTELLKVGCFLGDHVKSGIGTLLNTGAVIGAGANVFGGMMPPTVVPAFSWGAGTDLRTHDLERFLDTAEKSMARRGQKLTPGVRSILHNAWQATAGLRPE